MITNDQLLEILKKQYEVLAFVDLADVSKSVNFIYQIFAKCYQDSYKPNQRIVIYTSHQAPLSLLEHISQAAIDFDISPFFILHVSPFDIEQNLQKISRDSMQNAVFSIHKTAKLKDNYRAIETICPLPWMHVEVRNQGDFFPCCVYENDEPSTYNGIQDYFTHNLEQIRQQFLQAKPPSGCHKCFSREQNGAISNRQRHIKFYKKQFLTEWIDHAKIRSLDLKPGNVCNFKCRICGPRNSSLHVHEQLLQNPPNNNRIALIDLNRKGNWFDTNFELSQEIFDISENLINLDLMGGEPLLIKKVSELIHKLASDGTSKQIRMHLHTNGSVWPDNIVHLFKNFRAVDIALSIDNIKDRFELERGGSWHAVEKNVEKFCKLKNQGVNVYLYTTVNIQNVYYMDEILSWSDSYNLEVLYNHVREESTYPWSLGRLSKQAKQSIVDKFKNHKDQRLSYIGNLVENTEISNSEYFIQAVERYDQIRKEQFTKSHKEFAQLMEML